VQHKTLPHALYRASASASAELSNTSVGKDNKLNHAVIAYGVAWEKIAEARLEQDHRIKDFFLLPWQQTLNASLSVAIKARQAVRMSRLELDAAKQTWVNSVSPVFIITNCLFSLKSASPAKQEAARLEVENAEDDLVQKTEVAIQLMKTVLDNVQAIHYSLVVIILSCFR
jgi:Bin/amphiphysin/Rvs domain for vesicular trafficking